MRSFLRFWLPLVLVAGLTGTFGVLPHLTAQPVLTNTVGVVDAPSGSAPSIVTRGLDAVIGLGLTPKGGGLTTITGPLTVTGTLIASGGQSLGNVTQQLVYNGVASCFSDNIATPMIRTRIAQSDWALARTAAGAETQNIECALTLPSQLTASKGIRIDSFSIVQQITVVALTSATFQALATNTYANNVANSINATYGGAVTIVLPTATQANPYVTAATLATPVFMNTGQTQIVLDWQVVMANTGVYRVYAIIVNFTQALY